MTYTKDIDIEYIVPSDEEREESKISSRILSPKVQRDHPLSFRIVDEKEQDTEEAIVKLPAKVAHLLLDILVQMAEGKAVTILPTHAELTTQQAADLLNVSRPFFVKLIEGGEIPFSKVGTHRRVLLSDVLVYKKRTDKAREKSLHELAELTQELGIDY